MKKSLLLSLIISICSVLICSGTIFFVKDVNKRNSANVSAAYNFSSGTISSDANYTEYTIGTLAALNNFASSVNGGVTFANKTVKLTANIDCGGAGVGIGTNDSYFQGFFDGNGKTISNYSPNSYVTSTTISDSYKAYGLFTQINSSTRIANLKILNSGRSISGGDYKYVGGIVGNAEGATIENCSVENFAISTTDKTDRIYVSGIFAAGYATVRNCYVDNLTISNGCGASAGIGCAANDHVTSWGSQSFAWKRSNSTLDSCIVKGGSLTYSFITPTAYEVGSGAYDYEHTITNCYTTANTVTGLDYSSIGGSSGTIWYYYSSYNDGWPMLRAFISWVKIEVMAGNSYVETNVSAIFVPSGVTLPEEHHTETTATISFYGHIKSNHK